jgi:hypothetical protein
LIRHRGVLANEAADSMMKQRIQLYGLGPQAADAAEVALVARKRGHPAQARVRRAVIHLLQPGPQPRVEVVQIGEVSLVDLAQELIAQRAVPALQLALALDMCCSTYRGEGKVGTFDQLIRAGRKGDNITPHHIPSDRHMAQHGVSRGKGIAINMEMPAPGSGGRHRQTFTCGTSADVDIAPRDALAAGVRDVRSIYQRDGLYDAYIRGQLREVIRQNRTDYQDIFVKRGG